MECIPWSPRTRHRIFHPCRYAYGWIRVRVPLTRTTKAKCSLGKRKTWIREQTSLQPATARYAPSGENTVTFWTPRKIMICRYSKGTDLKIFRIVFSQCPNRRNKSYSALTNRSSRYKGVVRWTYLSSSPMAYTRQFKLSPFATISAELLIPHTNEDPCEESISM